MGRLRGAAVALAVQCLLSSCGASGPASPDADEDNATVPAELLVTLRTVGDQLDTDGYSIVIDGTRSVDLPLQDSVLVSDLTLGNHAFQLSGVAPNCRVISPPITGSLYIGSAVGERLRLEIFCLEPDPGTILYSTPEGVRSMNALGGDRRSLPITADKVELSRDQTRLVFMWEYDIWVANADGTDPRNLTKTSGRGEGRPSWSPDGQYIAYEGDEAIFESEPDIFVMRSDGSNVVNLTPDTPLWGDSQPAWSPDGTRIAFRSQRSGGGELWTVAPDGSQLTRLTRDGSLDTNASWSPDGQRLVFTRFTGAVAEGGTDFELFVINADGTGLTQLTNDLARTSEGDWSPDGRWIVFTSFRFAGASGFDLFMMRSDGSDRVQLTFGERAALPQWVPCCPAY